ncbi:hypothetical protein OG590_40460 (plasmid) [Streptomyces goshikiensis]|uniref:hypothetical protein n=1 Tax=Streptomyces goshikiensis TaxID=1942 RepID=UPI002F90F3D6|nr:hypothetical protein OG590_40460 [Streptomyces goshikiensis]
MAITSYNLTPYESQRAAALFMGFLDAVGDGCHELVVAASAKGDSLVITVPFHKKGEASDLNPDDALEAMVLLKVAASGSGGAVIRTSFADETSRVQGWKLVEFCAKPLNAVEIFSAYHVGARADGLIAPEWGVEYAAAPRLRA